MGTTFRNLLNCWPSLTVLARDLDCSQNTVASWLHRDSVPAQRWPDLVAAARRRKRSYPALRTVTLDALAGAAHGKVRKRPLS
jgi:hypothetical protein